MRWLAGIASLLIASVAGASEVSLYKFEWKTDGKVFAIVQRDGQGFELEGFMQIGVNNEIEMQDAGSAVIVKLKQLENSYLQVIIYPASDEAAYVHFLTVGTAQKRTAIYVVVNEKAIVANAASAELEVQDMFDGFAKKNKWQVPNATKAAARYFENYPDKTMAELILAIENDEVSEIPAPKVEPSEVVPDPNPTNRKRTNGERPEFQVNEQGQREDFQGHPEDRTNKPKNRVRQRPKRVESDDFNSDLYREEQRPVWEDQAEEPPPVQRKRPKKYKKKQKVVVPPEEIPLMRRRRQNEMSDDYFPEKPGQRRRKGGLIERIFGDDEYRD